MPFWNTWLVLSVISSSVVAARIVEDAICDKSFFLKKYVKGNLNIVDSEYQSLSQCPNPAKKCAGDAGSFSVSYAEDHLKRVLVLIKVENITDQGCWSYAIRIKDDVLVQTEYFNTGGSTQDFQAFYYIKLGFNYEFLVTPLPTGQPLTIKTKSPNLCEIQVLNRIRKRVENKELLSNCKGFPDYRERHAIATAVCQRYPNDILQRINAAQTEIIDTNCKLELIKSSSIVVAAK